MTYSNEIKKDKVSMMNGYSYQCEKTNENDTTILSHMVVMPNGEKEQIPWSPRSKMDEDDFKLWVHLGMPKNKTYDKHSLIEHLNSTMM